MSDTFDSYLESVKRRTVSEYRLREMVTAERKEELDRTRNVRPATYQREQSRNDAGKVNRGRQREPEIAVEKSEARIEKQARREKLAQRHDSVTLSFVEQGEKNLYYCYAYGSKFWLEKISPLTWACDVFTDDGRHFRTKSGNPHRAILAHLDNAVIRNFDGEIVTMREFAAHYELPLY